MKSLYESAFSYLTSQIDKKIDAINDEKDAAIDALEAEKDAAVDALESQKKAAEEAYQSQIDLLEQKKRVRKIKKSAHNPSVFRRKRNALCEG